VMRRLFDLALIVILVIVVTRLLDARKGNA
jgi:hypothetical protein